MPFETFRIGYRKWFDIWVDHRYFLNFGEQPFEKLDDSGTPIDIQATLRQIRNQYDVSLFWQIRPDIATAEFMRNQRIIFKPIPRGIRVGVAVHADETPLIEVADGLTLTFEIQLIDGYFMTYTDLEKPVMDALTQPEIVPEGGVPVARNRVFRWQNQAGSDQLNTGETIHLTDLMRFVPEDGRVARPPIGIITIEHTATNSLLDGGQVPANPPNFRVTLRNRTTEWAYRDTVVGSFALVQYGRIPVELSGRRLSNPTPASTAFRVDRYRSIIF